MNSSFKIDKLNNISVYDYYKFYIRNSRFLGVIWQCLTICFTICLLIVYVSPNWIGDSLNSPNRGHFGLFSFCTRNHLGTSYSCFGTWTDINSLPNSSALKATFVLVSASLASILICLFISIFSIIIKYERVFHICAWFQLFCTICLTIAVCVYPISWNVKIVQSVCGDEAGQFELGTCSIRWPYIIACISIAKIFLLTVLAFLLAGRQAKFILIYSSNNNALDLVNRHTPIERQYLE